MLIQPPLHQTSRHVVAIKPSAWHGTTHFLLRMRAHPRGPPTSGSAPAVVGERRHPCLIVTHTACDRDAFLKCRSKLEVRCATADGMLSKPHERGRGAKLFRAAISANCYDKSIQYRIAQV